MSARWRFFSALATPISRSRSDSSTGSSWPSPVKPIISCGTPWGTAAWPSGHSRQAFA